MKKNKCKMNTGVDKRHIPVFRNKYVIDGDFTLDFLDNPVCCFCKKELEMLCIPVKKKSLTKRL